MWPSAKVVAAARRGHVRELIRHPAFGNLPGLRSDVPHVFAIMGPEGAAALCDRCGEQEREPNPPGSGAPGEARKPLLAPGTSHHAVFLLTWLHRFAEEHRHEEAEEAVCPACGAERRGEAPPDRPSAP